MDEGARPAPKSAAAPGAIRLALHGLLIGVGWVGFFWLWAMVAQQPWESQRLVWLIAGSFLLAPLLTAAWVLHNRAIYRRKGERRAVTAPRNGNYTRDWRGRRISADWAALAVSPVVTIQIDAEGHKRYLGVGPSRPSNSAAVAPARPQRGPGEASGRGRLDPVRG